MIFTSNIVLHLSLIIMFIVYFNTSSLVGLLLYSCTGSYSAHLVGRMVSGGQYVDMVSRYFAYLRISPVVLGSKVDHGCDRPIESFIGLPPYGGLVEWDY